MKNMNFILMVNKATQEAGMNPKSKNPLNEAELKLQIQQDEYSRNKLSSFNFVDCIGKIDLSSKMYYTKELFLNKIMNSRPHTIIIDGVYQ